MANVFLGHWFFSTDCLRKCVTMKCVLCLLSAFKFSGPAFRFPLKNVAFLKKNGLFSCIGVNYDELMQHFFSLIAALLRLFEPNICSVEDGHLIRSPQSHSRTCVFLLPQKIDGVASGPLMISWDDLSPFLPLLQTCQTSVCTGSTQSCICCPAWIWTETTAKCCCPPIITWDTPSLSPSLRYGTT